MLDPVDRTSESDLIAQIDPSRMDEHLDRFEGLERFSGTEDEWEASEYIVETLESYGLDADVGAYEGYISRPEDASVTVTTPTRRDIDTAITTAFGASTPPAGVHGPVVVVDDVLSEGLAGVDVSDCIVLTKGLPGPELVVAAERAGARALVIESVTDGQLHEMIVTPVWGTPSVDDADQIPDLPVVEITPADAAWLRDRVAEGPTEATVRTEVTVELTTLPNPVGVLEGTDSDRYMVVGNHVDSWYEGMTDNATAMASTLELARIFAENPPRRGVVFGFWSAHSFGRFAGSASYADSNWLDLRENGVAYLHLDLNGLKGADSLWYQHMAELEDEQLDTLETVSDLPVEDETVEDVPMWEGSDRPGRAADQSFWGAGLSSVFCGIRLPAGTPEGGPIGGGWWWHTAEDTRDKVDIGVLTRETELYVALVSRVCNSPVLPHDYEQTVLDIESTVDQIAAAAADGVEFDAVTSRLHALRETLAAANGLINERADTDDALARAAEEMQVRVGNELIPALFMQQQEYGHEPARSHQLLPYLRVAEELPTLSGRDRRFAETKVQRGVSKLSHRLDRARRIGDAFVDSWGGQ
ncbi:MAG: M28 family peptidase [Halobacteriota archaeon]